MRSSSNAHYALATFWCRSSVFSSENNNPQKVESLKKGQLELAILNCLQDSKELEKCDLMDNCKFANDSAKFYWQLCKASFVS